MMASIPGNGVYVVQGEMSILLTAMKRGTRWSSHSHQDEENDLLIKGFSALKDVLNSIGDLRALDPLHFIEPFLEVVKSEDTTGPVTSLALSSISKFLSYGLIDVSSKSVPVAVERVADAVTHARFVGTDQASDGVVLMKILQVLRTLILSPIGAMLTNDSVCEIMLSCLRICFEPRLSELLRRCAEHYLKDMVQLLFTRLPYFSEDLRKTINMKKLKMRSGSIDQSRGKRKKSVRKLSRTLGNKFEENEALQGNQSSENQISSLEKLNKPDGLPLATSLSEDTYIPATMSETLHDAAINPTTLSDHQTDDNETTEGKSPLETTSDVDSSIWPLTTDSNQANEVHVENGELNEKTGLEEIEGLASSSAEQSPVVPSPGSELVSPESLPQSPSPSSSDTHVWYNSQGVRFTPQEDGPLVPYGLVSVRELFRFLVSLCNPLNRENTEVIIHVGLTLLTVALEVGADAIGKYSTLLAIVKDDLSRNLFMLLKSERLSIFAATLQLSFLLFESLRTHLKFQLELFLTRLSEIIVSDYSKISFEQKELALECVVQLWRIPGFVTELYLNYDCDLYCPNVYEDLTKLLSKNAFPVSGVYSTHLLSLDALLTIIDSIENHCNSRILNEKQVDSTKPPEGVMSAIPPPSAAIGRQKVSQNIPSHEQLMAIKRKKKLLATGSEHFNVKPKKGIQFLQEHHILSASLDPVEIVQFLKENPHLDKKMIGEYISSRSNLAVLDAFVKSFDFTDMRIDEALRLYLETFRLPGESPLISLLMEQFAEHWHKCNGEPFANADAAFTLAYAVIMLNVDQHNHNVKRQNTPMTQDGFKRNLKKVNGGENFDQDMLDEMYLAVKNEEIVMPAEQTGLVLENYLWKVLLRRGEGKNGITIHAPNGLLDHDLFSLIWGPTVAALSFMFDKSSDPAIYQKAIEGFRKCAMISAHYGMSINLDNLIVSLCKFTMLVNTNEPPDSLTILFGSNPKACLAADTVFNLAHRHGDIIREGWKNVLDCILQLYRCKMLPKILVEAEDFIDISGKISLMREEIQLNQKTETGLFSSIYSYISLGSEISSHRMPSPEDQDFIRAAQVCIRDCHLEQLITESKFLRSDSLHELVKALIHASYGPEGHIPLGTSYNEDTAVFFLELLLKVVIQNRDRVHSVWQSVRDHIYTLLMGAAACDHHFLVERSVVGLLRLAIRLMRREDMSPVVLQSLRMLLLLKATTLTRVSRQVSFGLFELLKTSAANIHSATDWAIIFTLLECVGAGAPPPRVVGKPSLHDTGAKSDGEVGLRAGTLDEDSGVGNERGCTSDSELSHSQSHVHSIPVKVETASTSPELSPNSGGGWIMVGREGDIQPLRPLPTVFNCERERDLAAHDPSSLVKCCESLAFLVRDVAHITPYNFENCVHCIRTFVEASLDSTSKHKTSANFNKELKNRKKSVQRKKEDTRARSPTTAYDADESDSEELPSGYHQVPIQLLDLMHTLHTRTAQIYRWWAEENADTELTSLWSQGWCPLLQGISRLCCDLRKQVRMSAITYLQRALLVHDLQTLNGDEWELCFNKVLFPLLSRLLESNTTSTDQSGLEETRMRAATLLSKVFLHHLTPLQSLPTFTALWMRILDYMDKYMHVDKSDLLYEAIPESLKNMLLVMDSAGVFSSDGGHSPLWAVTWDRIALFLPNLQRDVFKAHPPSVAAPAPSQGDASNPTTQDVNPPVTSSSQPQTWPEVSSVQHFPAPAIQKSVSTTIFPHMGQLISTPIGPPHAQTQPISVPVNLPQPQLISSPCESVMASTTTQPQVPFPPLGSVLLASTPALTTIAITSSDESHTPHKHSDAMLPVYGGFASMTTNTTLTPSAQFFYQDINPMVCPPKNMSSSPPTSSGGLLLDNTVISTLPILAPPDS